MKSTWQSKGVKMAIDICMTIFLVLSFVRWEGTLTFHAIVGTGCALFFTAHVCIHWKWIKSVTKSCFAGKLKKALRWKYIINMFLLIIWVTSVITGILAIGSYVGGVEWMHVFSRIHGVSARIGLGLVIIHIVQHWVQIKSYFIIKRKTA